MIKRDHPYFAIVGIAIVSLITCTWLITFSVCRLLDTARSEIRSTAIDLRTQATLARVAAIDEVRAARSDIKETLEDLTGEVRSGRIGMTRQVARANNTLAIRTETLLAQTDSLTRNIEGLRSDVSPGLQSFNRIGQVMETIADNHLVERGNGNSWPAQVTATLGATRFTLGQIAKASRTVSDSSVTIAAQTSDASVQFNEAMSQLRIASEKAAESSGNVARWSNPESKWARIIQTLPILSTASTVALAIYSGRGTTKVEVQNVKETP